MRRAGSPHGGQPHGGYVALYRALEHEERRRTRSFADPFARAFLPRYLRAAVDAARIPVVHRGVCRYADRRAPGARTSAIARTRCIDDVVRGAVASGVGQMVLLGAGFDCRAHRLPELEGAAVFEVDRFETQRVKRAVVKGRAGGRHVRYVAGDFLRDVVAGALAAAGWDAEARTAFVWEGVTNYSTEAAVAAVLAWVGSLVPGTTIVFTYVHAGVLDGSVRFYGRDRNVANVRRRGEPWTFGLHSHAVPSFVARASLALVEDLGADEYRARYLPGERALGYGFYRLAAAARPARRPKNVASAIDSPLL